MFNRQPTPERWRWWPAHAGIGVVLATIITVAVILTVMPPGSGKGDGRRRVMVSFVDKGEALAAQRGDTPRMPGTEIVRAYARGALLLAVEAGVSNAQMTLFYNRTVLVEDDPLVAAVPTGPVPGPIPQWRGTAVAVLDRGAGSPDFSSEQGANCIDSGRGARMRGAVGEPAVAIRVLSACDRGYAADIADALVWAAGGAVDGAQPNPTPARVLLLAVAQRGACPLFLQAAVDQATGPLGALVVAPAGDGGADNFPSNCAGVLSVREAGSAAMAHLAAPPPSGPGGATAWAASLAARAWTGNASAAVVRARLAESAAPSPGTVYGVAQEVPRDTGQTGANSTCPIDTYRVGPACHQCPRGAYAARGSTRCEVCPSGVTSACGYDCLTCGIPR
jgi:hypothetical protein